MSEVRVRFAPSPTGALHIGGVRTALYNYIFAKKNNGKFILRIEDTDQTRFVEGAEKYITESLAWLGINADESPEIGGEYGPYRQSERKPMYKDFAMKLIEDGNAYYAFDTSDELDAMRERLKAAKVPNPQYNSITRATMKNSLTLPADEVQKRLESGDPYVIRLKVPRKEEVRLEDKVRGWVMVHSSAIDDKVLLKSDGMPTYHLANVVDDHLMKITHVIRGEEWLPSAPLHVLLYKYLGWEDTMPTFAHLPLLLKPDGNGKLSKRDSEKHGFPIFPMEWKDPSSGDILQGFKEDGYLPEALNNFLALLGWNPGNNDEFFTLNELIESFSLEKIGKAGAKFDIQKAQWFNQHYLRLIPSNELAKELETYLNAENLSFDATVLPKICEMMKERVTFTKDIGLESRYFFESPSSYDEKVVNKKWQDDSEATLSKVLEGLKSLNSFTAPEVKQEIVNVLEQLDVKLGKVMPLIRLCITGQGAGPDLMEILEILGKDEVASRMEKAFKTINVKA